MENELINNKVGIVVAMKEELEEILYFVDKLEESIHSNTTFIEGKISNKECILVNCGVGKVNSARVTQKLVDLYKPKYIINVGVAGAINDNLSIGDVVISNNNIQHDFDITAFGHEKGYISNVGKNFYSDKYLVGAAQEVCLKEKNRNYEVKLGTITSGDIFCTDDKMKNKIRCKFEADVVDMECAAIAQVSILEEIPFVSIRSISDGPTGSNHQDFKNNLSFAAKRAAGILNELCKQLS